MKILFCGDIVGRSGRDALQKHLPFLREKLRPDVVIVNGENAAAGFGISPKLCGEIHGLGVDLITLGNHAWDQDVIIPYLDQDKRIVRPLNFPAGTPGRGALVHTTTSGKKVLLINAMGRIFMEALDNPFLALEQALKFQTLGKNIDAIVVDFHGEATSEKNAMGHFLDGQVSLVAGTHAHIPTADQRILPKGTAFITDVGMTGDYDSIIGMQKETVMGRMLNKVPRPRMKPAEGEATLCGIFVETDGETGLAKTIHPIRLGGILAPMMPA